MIDFFHKGIEYNKVAKSFEAMYKIISVLQPILEISRDDLSEFKSRYKIEILMLACIAKKGIIERLDEYNWGFESKIMVPILSHTRITIGYAWSQTITISLMMVALLNMESEWEEIHNDGPLRHKVEISMPSVYKNW